MLIFYHYNFEVERLLAVLNSFYYVNDIVLQLKKQTLEFFSSHLIIFITRNITFFIFKTHFNQKIIISCSFYYLLENKETLYVHIYIYLKINFSISIYPLEVIQKLRIHIERKNLISNYFIQLNFNNIAQFYEY